MIKSKKLYAKALDKYSAGFIEEALKLCEESISLNVNNSPAINLKGLLYYLQGDLNHAQNLWKTNLELNNDKVSKKYLEDTQKDKIRLDMYRQSLKFINDFKIKEAIDLLNKCTESDFNCINVNNQLSSCYIKKTEYNKAKLCIDRVLKVDKKNKIALGNKNVLIKNGIIKEKKQYKKIVASVLAVCLIIFIGINSKRYINNFKENRVKQVPVGKSNNTINIVKKQDKKITTNKKDNFCDDIQQHINNKKFELIYDDLKYAKGNGVKLNNNEKIFVGKAMELMKSEGAEYFYNTGNKLMEKKDFKNAILFLSKAYEYSKDTWQYPHVVYMLGVCNQNIGALTEAMKYYVAYDEKIKDNTYEDIVLYNLATLYKNIDKDKSKRYAEKLSINFSESIYNNSNIKNILGY